MLLSSAASFFDRTPCTDAYTGELLFMAQMSLYDDTKRDSEASERRVISTAAGVELPLRRVVEMLGAKYILGKANPDVFNGEVVRLGHVAHEASVKAHVKTLSQASLGQTGTEVWAAHAWVKNQAFTEQDSNLTPQFHLFFSTTEQVRKNCVVEYAGVLYITRAWNIGASGLLVALAEEITDPSFETAQARTGYDRVLGQFTGSDQPVRLLRLRWQSLFDYGTRLAQPFGPDECQLVISKSEFTPESGTQLTLSDGIFSISSVQSLGDVWVCRAAFHA